VAQAQFFLDNPNMTGTPRQTENVAPYDFAGGSTTVANPFNTNTLATGSHTITAKIRLSDGTTKVISSAFTIASNKTPTPTPALQPTSTSSGASFTQAQFEAAIAFDFEGENGKLQSNPSAPSIGYPCGVPNGYSWKFGGGGLEDVAKGVQGRGQQLAGAAYNQIYNACPGGTLGGRKVIPNARILTTDMVVSYFSISQQKWVTVIK